MNSKLEALISAYQGKPKKAIKKKHKPTGKLMPSETSKRLENRKAPINQNIRKNFRRENHSVQPKRSESTLSLSRYLNTSFEEDIERLESLTNKNSSISNDWISVKQRMIEINLKKKLNPIAEIDEGINEYGNLAQPGQPPLNLIRNYDSLMNLKIKEKTRSLNQLL